MSYPDIPDLPDAPLRSQPEEDYARTASAFVGAMNPWGRAVNAAGAWLQAAMAATSDSMQQALTSASDYVQQALDYRDEAGNFAENAQTSATDSGDHARDAEGYAGTAHGYAQVAAATANFKGEWGSLSGALAIPASVYHNGGYWQLLRNIPNVGTSEPGMTGDWAGTETEIVAWTAISGNATLNPNSHYRVSFPGSPITLTLPAAATNNDRIQIYKSSGNATGAVIARNGNTIMGLAQNLTIDADIVSLDLIYNGSDWRVK